MPRGLQSVVQPFETDDSKYSFDRMIARHEEFNSVIDGTLRKLRGMFEELNRPQSAGGFIRDYNKMLDDYNKAMGGAEAANRAFNAAQEQTERLSRSGRDALQNLGEAFGLVTAAADRHTAAQDRLAEAHMRDMPLLDQMVSKLGAAKDAYAAIPEANPALAYTTGHVEALNDALVRTRVNADGVTRALSETDAVRARIMAGSGGYGDAQRPVYYNPLLGGGGGGGIWPAVAQPPSGGGGDGGGFASAAGAFFGAMKPSNIFGAALPTVKMAHMITMFVMESLSTILPAAVAAGAAGAVGLQGGTNVYTSGTSLYNANEALGGAYGKTFGSYLGLGSSFQAAQNMANGGVYGITGGVLNLAGQGRDAFSNMGVQTVAMIDRGIANMVLNNRMSQVAGAVAGGTGDLRAFGDIGANIGDTLLNLAPNLPGLGPDLLGTLKGATGAASWLTGHAPGGLLQAGLAAEAGYRWGDLALSGGKLPWFLGGGKVGGLAGVAERMGLGTVGDAAAGVEATGLAGGLDAAGGPVTLGAAAIGFLGSKLVSSMPTPAQRQVGAWQGAIDSSFGANAWTPIQKALYGASQGHAESSTNTLANRINQITGGTPGSEFGRFGRIGPGSEASIYSNAMTSFGSQLANLVAAGPQAVKVLSDIGVKGATTAQALTLMTDAMVTPGMIGPGGKISATGQQLMKQFMTTYSPMVGTNAGAIGEAASAQDVMSSSAMKSLSTIQQAADGFNQIMMAGAGTAAQTTAARLGLPQGFGAALGQGPFTAAGAAAATLFETGTATQPGVVSSLQSDSDQLKTFLTLGALNSKQTAGIGGYELSQFLGPVQQSGSGGYLAQMMEQARQMGIPGVGLYNAKQSFAQNFASFQKAVNAASAGQGGATGLTNKGNVNLANLPALASSLITSQSGASPLDTAEVTQAGTQALAIQQALAGGKSPTGSLSGLVGTLMAGQGGKFQPGAISAGLKSILGQEGIGGSALSGLIKQGLVVYKAEYDRTNPPPLKGTVTYHSEVETPRLPVLHGVAIYTAQMAGLPGGVRLMGHQSGYKVPGYGGGDIHPAFLEGGEAVVPKHLVPQIAPFLSAHGVPGFAAGGLAGLPIFEANTAKDIAALAQAVSGLASVIGGSGAGAPMPAAAQKVFNAYDATLPKGMWGQFASQILQGLIEGVKNAPHETAKMAQALVSQVQQEVTYGQGVAAAAKQGGGYNPWGGGSTLLGTFGNFATPTTTAQGQPYQYYTDQAAAGGGQTLSVQQQMGDYLQAMKSFQGDLSKLGKAGLNKNLMQQLIAAGPLQGDQEAQSILGGAGGAKGANSLWNQINAQANKLGAGAAGSVYGTGGKGVKIPVHADTAAAQAAINEIHGKSVVISVSVNVGGAGGGAGGGGVKLSDGQIKQVTAQVQAALLKQAKRNRGTNIQLPGYAA